MKNQELKYRGNNAKWPQVDILIPCYNGLKYLPSCLDSIMQLDYPNCKITAIDDLSSDETADFIRKNYPAIKLIQHKKNLGLTKTFNEGIRLGTGTYVFLVNQDTVHSPDYLKQVVEKMELNPDLGGITGKVYKYDFDKSQKTNIIDSVGLEIRRDRRVVDIGQGEEDKGQYEQERMVFGLSGQNPLLRRSALNDIAVPVEGREHPEFFDEDFFMYKEDVDLSWRMTIFGWKFLYLPSAIAWHGRSTVAVERTSKWQIIKNRHKMNDLQKFNSIKNRYLAMIKNDIPSIYLKDLAIIWYNDIGYFFHNLILDTRNMGAYYEMIKKIPLMLKKRKYIQEKRIKELEKIRMWFK